MDDKNKKAVEIYNQIAEEYSKYYDSIDNEEDLVFLNSFLSHVKPNTYILDIGCGTGFSAGYFVKKGMIAEGSDFSSSMITIAQRNYPNIKFSIADMRDFKPATEVGAVWAGYSLFHFDQIDLEKTIENIKTYLKPNGIFGLVMQEGDGEVEVPEPFKPGETIYLHLYTEQQLKSILQGHGFKLLDMKRKIAKHSNEFSYNKILLIVSRKKSLNIFNQKELNYNSSTSGLV